LLDEEYAKLKRLLADTMLDNAALTDLLSKNGDACRYAGSGCPSSPRLARSVDGGFDDVRDIFFGRYKPRNRSINSGFVIRSSTSISIGSVNHTQPH
jgi:hypothetical protein